MLMKNIAKFTALSLLAGVVSTASAREMTITEVVQNIDCRTMLANNNVDYFDRCKKAAEAGNPWAQNYMGQLYILGSPLAEQDYQEAVFWFKKSAAQEVSESQYLLGRMYRRGFGVAKNEKLAYELIDKACKNDLPKACKVIAEWQPDKE